MCTAVARPAPSYGRFLDYLEHYGGLDRDEVPADRVFRDRVTAYGEQLRRQCRTGTVHGYILHLERALSVMAPDEDRQWLARLAARLKARARPSRDKRRRVVPAEELADLGYHLMDSALDLEGLRSAHRAVYFRDGLMISLLIARLLCLHSFTGLEVGRHIVPADGGYRIVLAPEDTKNGRPYEAPVPERLGPYMDICLEQMRPVLLGKRCSDRLWITVTGTDMSDSYLNHRLCKVTKRELGRKINWHLFRHCAMTSRAIDDPDNVRAMQPVLGHSSMRTSEMHYSHRGFPATPGAYRQQAPRDYPPRRPTKVRRSTMRAAIYARYSSNQQREASIDDQVRICSAQIKQDGYRLVDTYSDHAISGASSQRPGYQAMLVAAQADGFDVIVAEALDRLSRDLGDVAQLYKQLTFLGIRLVTLSEGEISELHVGLKGTMNALFLKDLANKTRRGLRGRVEQGRSGGGNAYGYDVVRRFVEGRNTECGKRHINPGEAGIVRRIFETYASGASPRRVALQLNHEGIPGPSGKAWGAPPSMAIAPVEPAF